MFALYFYFCISIVGIKNNNNMGVVKNLRVMINFYKKQCLPVITRNKRYLSKQVLPKNYALEKMFFVVAMLLKVCELFLLRQS